MTSQNIDLSSWDVLYMGVRAGLSLKKMSRNFERKVVRKINGSTIEKEGRRIKYSYEPYDLHNAPDVLKTIELSRLIWPGHQSKRDISMQDTSSKRDGSRKAGKPWIV
jgi:hypothetical protein